MAKRWLAFCFSLVTGLTLSVPVVAGFSEATPLEKINFTRISRADEIAEYMRVAAKADTGITLETLGDTVQGRAMLALVFGKPADAQTSGARLKVMLIGSQHGAAEPAGGEAMLVIARDLIAGDLRALRESMDIILIPDANPDGRDLLRRSNANMININTDFVLMSQPESRVLVKALERFQPDVILDSHESALLKRLTLAKQGYLTDFYAQFESANNTAVPASLRDFAFNEMLPEILKRVTKKGLPAHRYIGEIIDIRQPLTHGGLTLQNFRNMAGIHGPLSFLVETRLDSRDDPHPTYRNIRERVGRQLICLREFLAVVADYQPRILAHVQQSRLEASSGTIPLKSRYVADKAHPEMALALRRLDTRQLETLIFRDHRKIESADVVDLPKYLAVTDHEERLKRFLELHQIRLEPATKPLAVKVMANRFHPATSFKEGATLADGVEKTLLLQPQDLLIDLSQPLGRKALLLLDPRSTSNVFRYPDYSPLLKKDNEFFIYPVTQPLSRE